MGLIGALVIEPAGSGWVYLKDKNVQNGGELVTTRAAATVTPASGAPFKEFVVVLQTNAIQYQNGKLLTNNKNALSAINYRAESAADRKMTGSKSNAKQQPYTYANFAISGEDPQTPIFTAVAGEKVRFRLHYPAGDATNLPVFEIHGHNWQEEPYTSDSNVIGDNPLTSTIRFSAGRPESVLQHCYRQRRRGGRKSRGTICTG